MNEFELHRWLVYATFGLAVVTALVLLFISAPYGRHEREGWGPTLPSRVGWILMESPSFIGFFVIYALGANAAQAAPLALLALWQVHYVHRTVIFPFRMRSSGKRMPLVVALAGFSFNVLNAYINARWISALGAYPNSWLTSGAFLAGAGLMVAGFVVNLQSDAILFSLRKPGEKGYKVPHGGLYRFVSCPNYFGELLEWTGWAVATWSLAGCAFAVYTAANLLPRAIDHHRWYREKFPDYPTQRRAVIPFVL